MRYVLTRGTGGLQPFLKILLEGLAEDGGLYVPEEYPILSKPELAALRKMTYPQLACSILSKFADDIPAEDLKKIVESTYTKAVFGSDDITPLKKLEDGLFLLDLSEGP